MPAAPASQREPQIRSPASCGCTRSNDGFRVIAHKRVRLYSRSGNHLTGRFLLIVEALTRLRSRSCIIDGEAFACRENGIASLTASATSNTPACSYTPST
jgi:ATP-dependent DNA ligase